jgi:transmembrane sensor
MKVVEDNGMRVEDARLEAAVEWFMRLRSENARAEDLPELQRWIEADPRNSLAYQQVSATWGAVGEHANAPVMVVARRDALDDSRKAHERATSPRRAKGWARVTPIFRSKITHFALAAGIAAIVAGSAWWRATPQWTEYKTDRGEQTTQLLADGSVIALDADSRARVRYTENAREIVLQKGQARFTVAKDVLRPFRVQARDQTVVALGTQFDVDLVAQSVRVTLIEGRVAVTGKAETPASNDVIEMKAGEALRIQDDGSAVRVANVDLTRTTAWQSGKIFFDNEPLGSAVERINRYSRDEITVEPAVAGVTISGVFNAGDTAAFIEAVTDYFPVDVTRDRTSRISLKRRK